jgi:hypothetical protein
LPFFDLEKWFIDILVLIALHQSFFWPKGAVVVVEMDVYCVVVRSAVSGIVDDTLVWPHTCAQTVQSGQSAKTPLIPLIEVGLSLLFPQMGNGGRHGGLLETVPSSLLDQKDQHLTHTGNLST